jgi:hypothetical protein
LYQGTALAGPQNAECEIGFSRCIGLQGQEPNPEQPYRHDWKRLLKNSKTYRIAD